MVGAADGLQGGKYEYGHKHKLVQGRYVQGGAAGFNTGKGEKLSSSQAQPAKQAAWL